MKKRGLLVMIALAAMLAVALVLGACSSSSAMPPDPTDDTGIAIVGSADLSIAEGTARNAQVRLDPADAIWPSAEHRVNWTAANESTATVAVIERGLSAAITGVAIGATTVTAQLVDGSDTPVGEAVTFNITVGRDISGDFTDPIFLGIIREAIEIPTGPFGTGDVDWILGLNLSGSSIGSLNGIEHLVNLSTLFAPRNNLSSVDLSKNTALTHLTLSINQLTDIDLSTLVNLEYLSIGENQLTSLDLSNNPKLEHVIAPQNSIADVTWPATLNYLRTVDMHENAFFEFTLTGAPVLEVVVLDFQTDPTDFMGSPLLSKLDLSKNPSLRRVNAGANAFLGVEMGPVRFLNFDGSNSLEFLDLTLNMFTDFDGSSLPPSLRHLNISASLIGMTMAEFGVYFDLDVSTLVNLEELAVGMIGLKELDLYNNTALRELVIADNHIDGHLDLSHLTHLVRFWAWDNLLTSIDITGTALGTEEVYAGAALWVTNNMLPNRNAVIGWQYLPLIEGVNFAFRPQRWATNAPPTITTLTSEVPDGTVGVPYRFFFETDSGTPVIWSVNWPHAEELHLQLWDFSGELSGTPNIALTNKNFFVRVENDYGFDEQEFWITIHPAAP